MVGHTIITLLLEERNGSTASIGELLTKAPISFCRSVARDFRGQRAGLQIRVLAQRRSGKPAAEIRVERDLLHLLKGLQFEGVFVVVRPHAHLETGAEVQIAAQQQPQVGRVGCSRRLSNLFLIEV